MPTAILQHDFEATAERSGWLVGVDEAGRGPLAGPVTAGACALHVEAFQQPAIQKLAAHANDSKQLDEATRLAIYENLAALKADGLLDWEVCHANEAEIETHNILGATTLAMQRTLDNLSRRQPISLQRNRSPSGQQLDFAEKTDTTGNALVLIDGRPFRKLPYLHTAIVKGDGKSLCIALASVLAKVTRDKHMQAMCTRYPSYGFSKHKGYPTPPHRKAILEHGPCPIHRRKFLEKLLQKPAEQIDIPGL